MDCKLPECVITFREYVPKDKEEENEAAYDEGSYSFVHCDVDGCHELYWKGKNGSVCESCNKNVCENCSFEWNSEEECYCCDECSFGSERKLSIKEKRKQYIINKFERKK